MYYQTTPQYCLGRLMKRFSLVDHYLNVIYVLTKDKSTETYIKTKWGLDCDKDIICPYKIHIVAPQFINPSDI